MICPCEGYVSPNGSLTPDNLAKVDVEGSNPFARSIFSPNDLHQFLGPNYGAAFIPSSQPVNDPAAVENRPPH